MNRQAYQRCRLRIRYWRMMHKSQNPDVAFLRTLRAQQRQSDLLAMFRQKATEVAARMRAEAGP